MCLVGYLKGIVVYSYVTDVFGGWTKRVKSPECGNSVTSAAQGYREASHVLYENEAITFHKLIGHSPPPQIPMFYFTYTSIDLNFFTHICQNLRLQWIGFFLLIIQGCIQKFQDSTCKKKFAYLGC